MRVGVDLRHMQEGINTGIGQYSYNLLRNLIPIDGSIEYHLFYNAFKPFKGMVSYFPFKNVKWHTFDLSNKILNASLLILGLPRLDKLIGGVDVWLSLNFSYLSLSSSVRHILVVHDISFKVNPGFFTFKQNLWHSLVRPKHICKNADLLIAVSQSTKQDLVDLYRIDPGKIEVVYEGTSLEEPTTEIFRGVNLPKPYVFFLGTIEPRKNVLGVVEAFNILRSKVGASLLIAGRWGWKFSDVAKAINNSPYKEQIHALGEVTPEEKAILYKNADVFVFPSFYEGFGLPVLEAMSFAVPVVLSANSSLMEIGGNACVYVNAFNVFEIAKACEEILQNGDLKKRLGMASIAQSAKFSWENTAQSMLRYIRSLK